MNANSDPISTDGGSADELPPSVSPNSRVSRGAVIAAFIVMIGVGLGVYAIFPDSVGGPRLPVSVKLTKAAVETTNGQIAVMTEVVTVTNELDQPIKNLAIELNGQYLLMQASPIEPAETLELPLSVFTDKRSSQRFDPSRYKVDEVIVRGQLPSKQRGVSKFEFDHEGHPVASEDAP
ncbi:hypothetical protein [Rhodopirellula sp. MGV]|uniref:hypothetical protein n=1 Tax=Rhodopirellula sp. MGV TaxID=2023130 RepID=UPI000B96CF96|nr:hypothetical protein [Rhodopirellula sp. MGV]OYP36451.1 hypothetical protein CGZ80_09110 [Rhodopirellula sp. MGV]PNY36878.1 hypothetical protein C2E31_11020 [Rhodopirellula baltica]